MGDDGAERGFEGAVGPDSARDPANIVARRADRGRARRALRHDEAVDVAPLRCAERGGSDPEPPRGPADLLLVEYDGGRGRADTALGPVRDEAWRRERGILVMTRLYWITAV